MPYENFIFSSAFVYLCYNSFMKVKTSNIEDTKKLAEIFASCLSTEGAFVSLFGDIDAGKTAFARCVFKALGVKEKITSPSFVILNEYKGAKLPFLGENSFAACKNSVQKPEKELPIYHFDLYRLENEGLETIKEELREYSRPGVLTFVEWADFGAGELPYNRLNIKVFYDEAEFNDTRYYEFEPVGAEYEEFVRKIAALAKSEGLLK